MDVVVIDKKGQPVSGLTKEDFLVRENGVPHALTTFDAVVVPDAPRRRAAAPRNGPGLHQRDSRLAPGTDVHPVLRRRAPDPPPGLPGQDRGRHLSEDRGPPRRQGDTRGQQRGRLVEAPMPEGQEELLSILKRLDGRYIPDSSPDRVTEYEAMRIVVYQDVAAGPGGGAPVRRDGGPWAGSGSRPRARGRPTPTRTKPCGSIRWSGAGPRRPTSSRPRAPDQPRG